MARGWESKSVEDQQRSAEDAKTGRAKPAITPAERERQARRDGLLLSRARVVRDLAAVRSDQHRALLERTLAHLDRELNGIA